MIAFLPVTRFRVTYVVGAGRPYSSFERFLLEAVSGGAATIDELAALLCVHRRTIVEGLVSLLHARWVSLSARDGSTQFIATRRGQAALKDTENLPEKSVRRFSTKSVVMEHVTGQISQKFLTLRRKQDLKEAGMWGMGIPVRSRIRSSVLEPGQVRPFLPVRVDANEYIRWIESIEPTGTTSFVLAEINLETQQIRPGSIPREWERLLIPRVIEDVRAAQSRAEDSTVSIEDLPLRSMLAATPSVSAETSEVREMWPIDDLANCLVVGAKVHLSVLKDRLGKADSLLVIQSSFLGAESVKAIAPHIKAAINRGVRVDILWGRDQSANSASAKEQSEALGLLKTLESEQLASGGRLLVVDNACHSNANVLVSDPKGEIEVVVGSHAWLAEPHSKDRKTCSVRLRHPGPVARLCLVLADELAYDERLRTSASVVGLRNAAARLERCDAIRSRSHSDGGRAEVGLVFDQHHISELAMALAKHAGDNLTVFCDVVQTPSMEAIVSLMGDRGDTPDRTRIVIDEAAADLGDAKQFLAARQIEVTKASHVGANCAVVGERVAIVGNYPWLSESLIPRRASAFEIGVVLEGEGVGELVCEALL